MPSRTLGRRTSGFLSQADNIRHLGPIIHFAQPPQLVGHPLGRDPKPLDLKTLPTFKAGPQPPQTGYGSKAKRFSNRS